MLKEFAMTFKLLTLVFFLFTVSLPFVAHAQNAGTPASELDSKKGVSAGKVPKEIPKTLMANYKAMEEKDSKSVLSLYHPRTNLISTKDQLDQYFSQVDVSYKISNIRYVGNDGENFVIVYSEVTEFRRKGNSKVFDKEDTDVLMVFRKHDGKFKIFTSRSLKPGDKH